MIMQCWLQAMASLSLLRDLEPTKTDILTEAIEKVREIKEPRQKAGLADIIDIIKEDYESDCTRLSNADIIKMLEPFAGVTKSGEPSRLMQSKDSCDYCDGVNCELCIDKHLFNGREAIVL